MESSKAAFSFLLDFQFRVTWESPSRVRFETDTVFVDVFHVPRENVIEFKVGTIAQPKDALTVSELLMLAGVPNHAELRPNNEAEMREGLVELAERLRTYGQLAIKGDPPLFEAARELRRIYTRQFMRKEE